MARGQQKIQSQQKAQEKAAKMKKQEGHSLKAQKDAASKALAMQCVICKSQMRKFGFFCVSMLKVNRCNLHLPADPKTYKQHFENKHPKNDMPQDLKDLP